MKVKVISVFRDKFTGKYYTPGEVIEVGEEAVCWIWKAADLLNGLRQKIPK